MEEKKIYAAITNTMRDIGAVGKNDVNTYDKYRFRGIDAVMNALNPAMIKNGIFAIPTVLDCHREEREGKSQTVMMYTVLTVRYDFFADDGSSVSAVVIGEAMDRSDKSTNKAMSAAFKYACFQTFCIPTEELLEDADKDSPEIGRKAAQKSGQGKATVAPEDRKEEAPAPKMMSDKERDILVELCKKRGYYPSEVFNGWPYLTAEQYGVAVKRLSKGGAT